jgi:transcriptional regulator with XRE-family HTH domain
MAKWRTLEEYTPFARLLVEFMWAQRPPLLPNQFAERMRVRKQALSTWLNSDAVPAPPVLVRLARGMGRPVRELMTAAGFAPADDPLLDTADAWVYVLDQVQRALGINTEDNEDIVELEAGRHAEEADESDADIADIVAPNRSETGMALLLFLRQLQSRPIAMPEADERSPDDPALASKPPTPLYAEGEDISDAIDPATEVTNEQA